MDKSFNDQELSDIMKEIEALEVDFKQEEPSDTTHEVLEELAELKEHKAIPLKPSFKAAPAEALAPATAMSFKVQGNLNLQLQFDIGGKVVEISVSESGLDIQLEGGVCFKVPVHKAAA